MTTRSVIVGLALLPGAAATHSQGASSLAALDCMIQPHQVVQVGTPAPGVTDSVLVERVDVVQRGQPLVQLGASVERAALAVARERACQKGGATAASSSRESAPASCTDHLREKQRTHGERIYPETP